MSSFLFGLVGLALLADMVLGLGAPHLLARFAFVRLGERRRRLSPRAKELLTGRRVVDDGSYRAAPALEERLDTGPLAEPHQVDVPDGRVRFAPGGDSMHAIRRPDFMRRQRPVVRIQMELQGDELVLRARYFPSAMLTFSAFVLVIAMASIAGSLFFAAVFALSAFAFDRVTAQDLFDKAEAEIAARVARLEASSPPVRVASVAPARPQAVDATEAEVDAPAVRGSRSW
jgi:hypothetical protein